MTYEIWNIKIKKEHCELRHDNWNLNQWIDLRKGIHIDDVIRICELKDRPRNPKYSMKREKMKDTEKRKSSLENRAKMSDIYTLEN